MKVFVGYGYHDRDKWVERFVFPIIRAFGDEVVTGADLQGDQISDAVRQKIRHSNALIGFLTRRDGAGGAQGVTHRWVIEELALALGSGLRVVEVREDGVDDQAGLFGDRQRIPYIEAKRDECLVELVKAVGNWHNVKNVQLQLLPEDCALEIFPLHRKAGLRCAYRLRVNGEAGEEIPTKIEPIGPGLFVEARSVPRQALIQIRIEYQGKAWTSSFESIESIGIRLRRDV